MYPARVTLPSGAELDQARLFVADGEVLVYVASGGLPRLFFQRPLLSSEGSPISGMNLQVEDGIVRVRRGGGCGCGHPLKRFNPWPGERRQLVSL